MKISIYPLVRIYNLQARTRTSKVKMSNRHGRQAKFRANLKEATFFRVHQINFKILQISASSNSELLRQIRCTYLITRFLHPNINTELMCEKQNKNHAPKF
jgi:hypothetical protein